MTADVVAGRAPNARAASLDLARDGAQCFAGRLDGVVLSAVEHAFDAQEAKPGVRLYSDIEPLRALLRPVGALARDELGPEARPVRILLFNKRPGMNWALGLHQDRTIAVAERRDTDGFGPWSIKNGQPHVQPPQAIIDRMLTMRVHLDDTGEDAAPLLVLPGSHRLGRLSEADIAATADLANPVACLARRGDVWVYATAIVHGSDAFRAREGQRRVLQIDYSADNLPGGLEWALQL